MKNVLFMTVLAIGLTGCGGAPTEQDLKVAVTNQINSTGGEESVKSAQKSIDSLKIIACSKADSNGYKCDWNSDMGAGSGRLVKGDSGWVVIPNRE